MRNYVKWVIGIAVGAVVTGIGAIFVLTMQRTPEQTVLPTGVPDVALAVTPTPLPLPPEPSAPQMSVVDLNNRLQAIIEEKAIIDDREEVTATPAPPALPEIP